MPIRYPPTHAVAPVLLSAACALAGCRSPSAANIKLRKDLQARDNEIVQLKRQHEADRASIVGLTSRSGAAAVAMLPPDRLDRLFTVHGIKISRLTGGSDLDPSKPG